jgi:hypothetical protein
LHASRYPIHTISEQARRPSRPLSVAHKPRFRAVSAQRPQRTSKVLAWRFEKDSQQNVVFRDRVQTNNFETGQQSASNAFRASKKTIDTRHPRHKLISQDLIPLFINTPSIEQLFQTK